MRNYLCIGSAKICLEDAAGSFSLACEVADVGVAMGRRSDFIEGDRPQELVLSSVGLGTVAPGTSVAGLEFEYYSID